MHMEAVTQFACKPGQTSIHASNVNWNDRMLNGSGVEERRHQCELVILTAIVQLCAVLPAIPQYTDCLNLFTQFTRYRFRPRHTKSSFDVCFHLCAKPKDESST